MSVIVDKEILKESLNDLIKNDPIGFKTLISDVINKNTDFSNDTAFQKALKKSFSRFDETYKALA